MTDHLSTKGATEPMAFLSLLRPVNRPEEGLGDSARTPGSDGVTLRIEPGARAGAGDGRSLAQPGLGSGTQERWVVHPTRTARDAQERRIQDKERQLFLYSSPSVLICQFKGLCYSSEILKFPTLRGRAPSTPLQGRRGGGAFTDAGRHWSP